jgi:hypothetical protein
MVSLCGLDVAFAQLAQLMYSWLYMACVLFSACVAYPNRGCVDDSQATRVPAFYPNLHSNITSVEIPKEYIERMQAFLDVATELVLADFPPSYVGEFATVYGGTAGFGALCLRMYRLSNNLNQTWLHRARKYIDNALERTTAYKYFPIENAFMKGRIGICAVGAVIYNELGNRAKVAELVKEVNWILDQPKLGDYYDWESGFSGMVYAADYLNSYFGHEVIDNSKVQRILHLIFETGFQYVNKSSGALRFEFLMNHYWTGMGSHGSGSPIYSLLKHAHLLNGNETILNHLRATVDWYLELQTEEGQIPGDFSVDRTQWCHGIPGLLGPIGEAYSLFKDEKYKLAGLKGCNLIAKIGILTKGMMLCHGVSSNVYMMIEFYRKTKVLEVLHQAVSLILTTLDTPQLSSPDPSKWFSHDCDPVELFGNSPAGAVLFYADVLANLNDLTKLQFLAFDLSY